MSALEPNLCRGCALHAEENEPLFFIETSPPDGTKAAPQLTEVARLLAECLAVDITLGDGYPASICVHCQQQLKAYADFKASVLRIHRHYTRRLKRTFGPTDEDREKGIINVDPHADQSDQKLDESVERVNEEVLDDATGVTFEITYNVDDEEMRSENEYSPDGSMEEIYLDDTDATVDYSQVDDHLTQCRTDEQDHPIANSTAINKADQRELFKKGAFKCLECKCKFGSQKAFRFHICLDHKTRRYRCDVCENVFKTLYSLNEHMMRHSGLRSFACQDCSKSFKTPADLYVHRRIHSSNLRKYVCDVCGYACRSSSHLVHHLVIHSDERPFKCDLCPKTFKRKDMLDGHVLSLHSAKSEYVCQVCGASFGLKQRLKRHTKIHLRTSELDEEAAKESEN